MEKFKINANIVIDFYDRESLLGAFPEPIQKDI